MQQLKVCQFLDYPLYRLRHFILLLLVAVLINDEYGEPLSLRSQQYSESASLYEKGGFYDKAASVYIRAKNW